MTAINHDSKTAINHDSKTAINHAIKTLINHDIKTAINHDIKTAINHRDKRQLYNPVTIFEWTVLGGGGERDFVGVRWRPTERRRSSEAWAVSAFGVVLGNIKPHKPVPSRWVYQNLVGTVSFFSCMLIRDRALVCLQAEVAQ